VAAVSILVAAVMSLAGAVLAQEQGELLAVAEQAESRLELGRALDFYARAEAADPRARLARRAQARREWLSQRSEGNFVPLATLMQARARVSASIRAEDLAALARDVRSFPSGIVRREALQLIADGYRERLDRPREALDAYLEWSREPGITEAERQLAVSGAALSRARLGQTDQAIASMAAAGLSRRAEASYLRASRTIAIGGRLAWAVLAFYLTVLAVALVRHRHSLVWRSPSRMELLFAVYALCTPLWMIHVFDHQLLHACAPIVVACGAFLGASRGAACALADVTSTRERTLLGVTSAATAIAVSFLVAGKTGMLLELIMARET
jgi:hypothetical protein